ncbi:hypothetical protein DESC_600080 [Desulfosarcina cetonica]|nr:hypothetical protein DESC_600080 [Desulfosarcina cetonica]
MVRQSLHGGWRRLASGRRRPQSQFRLLLHVALPRGEGTDQFRYFSRRDDEHDGRRTARHPDSLRQGGTSNEHQDTLQKVDIAGPGAGGPCRFGSALLGGGAGRGGGPVDATRRRTTDRHVGLRGRESLGCELCVPGNAGGLVQRSGFECGRRGYLYHQSQKLPG